MLDMLKEKKNLIPVTLCAFVAILGLLVLTGCKEEKPTVGESVSEVGKEMRDGVDETTDAIEDEVEKHQDRTVGEKIGDEMEDAGEEIQERF